MAASRGADESHQRRAGSRQHPLQPLPDLGGGWSRRERAASTRSSKAGQVSGAALAGPAAWPILTRVVVEGASLRDCRRLVPEIVTPWRADAVLADRLRVGLDRLGEVVGVTARGR